MLLFLLVIVHRRFFFFSLQSQLGDSDAASSMNRRLTSFFTTFVYFTFFISRNLLNKTDSLRFVICAHGSSHYMFNDSFNESRFLLLLVISFGEISLLTAL
ncbi:hypothetical protein GQ457_12G019520 [Hibiscus cannabinus]